MKHNTSKEHISQRRNIMWNLKISELNENQSTIYQNFSGAAKVKEENL